MAHTITDIVEDVEQALVALEDAVALVYVRIRSKLLEKKKKKKLTLRPPRPVLAPIIKELSAILNGPLAQLLKIVTSLVSGLLPVVQKTCVRILRSVP